MYSRKRIAQLNELMTVHLEVLAIANLSALSRQKIIAHLQALNKELTFLLSLEQVLKTPAAKVKKRRSLNEVWEKRRLERFAIKKKRLKLEIDTTGIMGASDNRNRMREQAKRPY